MPALLNQIKQTNTPFLSSEFVFLQGTIQYQRTRTRVFNRMGVDGTGIVDVRKHGTPFQLLSLGFWSTFGTAHSVMTLKYLSYIGGPSCEVIQNGVTLEGKFFVLDVTEARPLNKVAQLCGDLPDEMGTPAYIRQELVWTLIHER